MCVTWLSRRRFFFYFILFCQAHFFMLRGSESIHRKAVAAATAAMMHATVRSHGGVRPPCYSIESFARFSQSIPRNWSRLRLFYKKIISFSKSNKYFVNFRIATSNILFATLYIELINLHLTRRSKLISNLTMDTFEFLFVMSTILP